ncbi:acyl carrier protein [Kitasatospora sp. NPDC058170]|uniref:acyl carrier protein n=1 Tax=Kitasatospora sp. NPDC058170 TaxID=3346364 RepID=UPI0036DEB937
MSVDTTASAAGGPLAAETATGPGADTDTGTVVEDVVAVFGRVLECQDVTADSDFFLLGGDSLVATRVLSAVARRHGVELAFEDFLLAPTPRALAERIAAAR